MAGNDGVEHHQEGRGRQAHNGEQGIQAAPIAEGQIDVGGADAAHHQIIAHLLHEKDQCDPQKLVVAGDGAPDFAEADRRGLFLHFLPVFPNAENGEAQEQRSQYTYDQRYPAVGRFGVSAQRHAARSKHGDDHAGQRSANARKQRRPGGEAVAGILVRPKRRHHAPVGNIVHGVGDGIHQIDEAEERHEAPAFQSGVEGGVHHRTGQQNADQQPWLEFAIAGASAFDDVAHNGVIQRIEYPSGHHNGRNGRQLRRRQAAGEQNVGQDKVGKQGVDHIPAYGAQGEHPQVFLRSSGFVHREETPLR